MLLNRLLIKAVAPTPKIEKYKRYLFIAPHPDDIEIAVGGTVARLAREGKEVYYKLADTETARLVHKVCEEMFQITCPLE